MGLPATRILMLCPICAAEFRSELSGCPKCDCPLIPVSVETAESQSQRGGKRFELVELCRPASWVEAMLVKQLLEQNGIPALINGVHALSLMPHLATFGEVRVAVNSRDLLDARALYQGYFQNDDDTDFIADDEIVS
jgi:hypothetical protein